MYKRLKFLHDYSSAKQRVMDGQDSAPIADVGITHVGRIGNTAVMLQNIRLDEAWSVPSFDIAYAHVRKGDLPRPQLLAGAIDGLPANTRFLGSGFFAAELKLESTTIDVSVRQLARRAGLFLLAHEIGHVTQAKIVTTAVETAIGVSSDRAGQESIAFYAPAVDALTDYAKHNSKFRDDYLHTRDAWLLDGETISPFMHQPGKMRIPVMARDHERADEVVNAIVEASAWMGALSIVETGQIHPGLSMADMHKTALWAVGTYDQEADLPLHAATLTYALKY